MTLLGTCTRRATFLYTFHYCLLLLHIVKIDFDTVEEEEEETVPQFQKRPNTVSKETYNKLTHSTCTGARRCFARALELAPQVVLSITLLGTKHYSTWY